MDLEQAISTAIEYETKVHQVYREAAEKADDEVGRRVFQVLAREEAGHISYLRQRLAEWKADGKIRLEEVERIAPDAETVRAGAASLGEKLERESSTGRDEVRLLQKALEVERETSEFYGRMVDQLDGDGRELFARFLEIEQGHGAIVQAEIDAINGHGFWFDMPEFRLG